QIEAALGREEQHVLRMFAGGAVSHSLELRRVFYEALGDGEADAQFHVVSWRAHEDRHRHAAEAELQWFLRNEPVDRFKRSSITFPDPPGRILQGAVWIGW